MTDYLIKRPMCLSALISAVTCIGGFYSRKFLVFSGCIILILLFIMAYRKYKGEIIFALLIAFAVVISMFFEISKIEQTVSYSGNSCKGEYIVITEPELLGEYYRTTLEVQKSEILKRNTRISVIYSEGNLSVSEHITADISLKDFENSPYKASNYSEKIFLGGNMSNIEQTGKTDFVLENIAVLRGYIEHKIFDNYNFPEAATMLALLTGNKSYFSDEFYSNLKCAGVSHLMVVSGMHLSVIIAYLLYAVNKLFYNKYLKAFIIFVAVLTVFGICGFKMSIMRAGITYILSAVALLIDKPNTPANTLGTAVTIILLTNPFEIFNLAFQLSVLSTFGILVVAIPISEYVKQNNLIKNKVLLMLFFASLISVSAAVMTAPIVIYYFGYISNVLIITNMLLSYPSTVALVLCITGLLFPVISKSLFWASGLIIKYINNVINYFGSLSFSVTYLEKYTAFLAAGIIIIILLLLVACKRRIDMVKLNKIRVKKIKEGGKRIKWR